MNMTFKAAMLKEWTLTDDKIIIGKQTVVLLSEITSVKYTKPVPLGNGVIQIFIGNKFYTLAFPGKQRNEGEQAYKYIQENYGGINQQAARELEKEEFRMRCNVCGEIFCYTMADLRKNRENAKMVKMNATVGVLNAIGGSNLIAHASNQSARDYLKDIVDYSKCPKCHSSDLSPLKEGENENAASTISADSSVEELKKLKELLDMGVITQEDFDAKKKQLLGL